MRPLAIFLSVFAISVFAEASQCTDFSGSWRGKCEFIGKLPEQKGAFFSGIIVRQKGCDVFEFDGQSLKLNEFTKLDKDIVLLNWVGELKSKVLLSLVRSEEDGSSQYLTSTYEIKDSTLLIETMDFDGSSLICRFSRQ